MSTVPPLACDLSALNTEALDEHEEISETVLGSVTEVRERPNGYAFRLPTETRMIQRAATFVARERLCCPFFDFTLEIERDHGPVWLTLSGRDGVKPYVEDHVVPVVRAAQENEDGSA